MGFDLDRSEVDRPVDADAAALQADASEQPAEESVFGRALSQNLIAERFAIDAYRKIAEHGDKYDKATLRLAGGRTLVVSREGAGAFVQNVSLDGAPFSNSWLPLTTLHTGTTQLHFKMGQQPNKERGADETERPPSFR